jgi:malate dehydrogenase
MREVAIVGAGPLGGTLAHVLARRDLVSRIRLIDEAGEIAAGTALDIMQTSPIERFSTVVTGSTDVTTVAGASLVVVADRAAGAEWHGDQALLLVETITRLASRCLVVCAGASQRELVERSAREARIPRSHVLGSAPEALAAALREIVALEARSSARDVALTVLGIPPDQTVVLWEGAAIAGVAATDTLDEPARRRIVARVGPLWPPGPYSLALAAAEAISAIVGRSRRSLSCFTAPDDTQGRRARAVALPVRLGPNGLRVANLPPLAGHTRVALERAMLL